jgi:hypothetical protein
MRVRALSVVLAALVIALPATATAAPRKLRTFTSCGALLGYARQHGQQAVRTGWVPTPFTAPGAPIDRVPAQGGATAGEGAPAPQAAQDSGATGPGTPFSTTNNQEEGVDEPDVVKTDGRTLYAVANGVLHAIDVSGDTPTLVGALTLDPGFGQQLLLHGNRLVVLQTAWIDPTPAPERQTGSPAPDGGSTGSGVRSPGIAYPGFSRPVTRLTEVDVSDPSALKIVAREHDDGEFVAARMVGDTARVVLASRAPVMYAVEAVSAPTQQRAMTRRLRSVRRASLAAWRPHRYFRKGRRARFRSLVPCERVRYPRRFSGLDTVTILTVDMAHGLPSVDASAIMSDADVVYGSANRLYVATQRFLSPQAMQSADPPPMTTEIHEFDTSAAGHAPYVATGTVGGYLLNQYAMSAEKGVLRVASTDEPSWWPGKDDTVAAPSSAVTTLDETNLTRLGRVGGLGNGQRIFAVRFIGDTAYVVTFRRFDPLYTVDLSDPSAPRVAGQLELEGYSAYLHPVGHGLLLGVGQTIVNNEPSGTQMSLFDVADPAHPSLLASHAVGDQSHSDVEYDPHAFLYWPQSNLAVLPVQAYGSNSGQPFVGAIGFRVTRSGIAEVGRVSHPHDDQSLWPVQRAAVVGGRLYTLSSAGVLSSALGDLAAGPFVAFPDVPAGYSGCGGGGAPPPPGVAYACPVAAAR